MAFQFPSASVGQQVTNPVSSQVFTWNGEYWKLTPVTASQAISASYALTASYISGSTSGGDSLSASFASSSLTASYSEYAVAALTASYALSGPEVGVTIQFLTASNTWSISHNLDTEYPVISIWQSGSNKIIQPDNIKSIDSNNAEVTFTIAQIGFANVIKAGTPVNPYSSSNSVSASYALTSSYALQALTASFAVSYSYNFVTQSFVASASIAETASYMDPKLLNPQTIGTSSVNGGIFITASNIRVLNPSIKAFGDGGRIDISSGYFYNFGGEDFSYEGLRGSVIRLQQEFIRLISPDIAVGGLWLTGSNMQFSGTGSFGTVLVSGSLRMDTASKATIPNLTGSLEGTASYALTASYVEGGVSIDTSAFITTGSVEDFTFDTQTIKGAVWITGSRATQLGNNTNQLYLDPTSFRLEYKKPDSVPVQDITRGGISSFVMSRTGFTLLSRGQNNAVGNSIAGNLGNIDIVANTISSVNLNSPNVRITGSLLGTASQALTASYALNVDLPTTYSQAYSASVTEFAHTASNVATASYALEALTASFAVSYSYNFVTQSNVESASFASSSLSASFVLNAQYATASLTASYSHTASYVELPATYSNAFSSSIAEVSLTASYVEVATTASYVDLTTGSAGILNVNDLLKADYLATANYSSDAEAALNGIPVNGVYRTGNMLVVRLA